MVKHREGKGFAGHNHVLLGGLVVLLLVVTYIGQTATKPVWVSLPTERTTLAMPVHDVAEEGTPVTAITPHPLGEGVMKTSTFDAYRSSLLKAREEATAMLNAVIDHPDTGLTTLETALNQKIALARSRVLEEILETELAARGYPNTLATVNGNTVTLIVECITLTQTESAKLLEMTLSQTGTSPENVRIIPVS